MNMFSIKTPYCAACPLLPVVMWDDDMPLWGGVAGEWPGMWHSVRLPWPSDDESERGSSCFGTTLDCGKRNHRKRGLYGTQNHAFYIIFPEQSLSLETAPLRFFLILSWMWGVRTLETSFQTTSCWTFETCFPNEYMLSSPWETHPTAGWSFLCSPESSPFSSKQCIPLRPEGTQEASEAGLGFPTTHSLFAPLFPSLRSYSWPDLTHSSLW